MGLSSFEIVLEVEEAFAISLPSDESQNIRTVGELHALVLKLVSHREVDSNRCLSTATFYELRRAIWNSEKTKAKIRPTSSLASVFPISKRRRKWRELQSNLNWKFPRLELPTWLMLVICVTAVVVAFPLFFYFLTIVRLEETLSVVLAISGAALIAVALNVLTLPLALYPRNCSTVGDIVKALVGLNYRTLSEKYSASSSTDVWNLVQAIVSEQLGVDKSLVTPQARFVEDLGAD